VDICAKSIEMLSKLNKNLKLITIPQHILFSAGIVSCVIGSTSLSWLLVSYIGWLLIGFMGFNVFYHRYIAHSTFKTWRWLEVFGIYCGLLAGRGSPMWMANLHTPQHHRYADTDNDPHTPRRGFWFAYWTWQNETIKFSPVYCRKIFKDSVLKFMSRHYYKIFWVTAIILLLIDWRLAIFGLMGAGVIQTHNEAIINSCGHMKNFGTRDFEVNDDSRNLRGLFALWTLGNSLHNNHHAYPNSYTYTVKKYDYDLAGRFIELIATEKLIGPSPH